MLDAQRRPPQRVGHIKVGEYRLSLEKEQVRIRACLQGEPKARMKNSRARKTNTTLRQPATWTDCLEIDRAFRGRRQLHAA